MSVQFISSTFGGLIDVTVLRQAIRTIQDAEAETQSNDSKDLYIEEILADGTKVERKVDKKSSN
ncbi:hypothetical protein BU17DRAFT_87954 [Hysterangium stoloniferum]|nr:hypothetical protein BU17DRAFT_87954 [Hysterangium stoloniferum]